MKNYSVDRCLKSLGIDAERALRIIKGHLRKAKMDRDRARRNYIRKRGGEAVDRALLV